jgi:hypothetical protein
VCYHRPNVADIFVSEISVCHGSECEILHSVVSQKLTDISDHHQAYRLMETLPTGRNQDGLFLCSLFNDAFSVTHDYIASN